MSGRLYIVHTLSQIQSRHIPSARCLDYYRTLSRLYSLHNGFYIIQFTFRYRCARFDQNAHEIFVYLTNCVVYSSGFKLFPSKLSPSDKTNLVGFFSLQNISATQCTIELAYRYLFYVFNDREIFLPFVFLRKKKKSYGTIAGKYGGCGNIKH